MLFKGLLGMRNFKNIQIAIIILGFFSTVFFYSSLYFKISVWGWCLIYLIYILRDYKKSKNESKPIYENDFNVLQGFYYNNAVTLIALSFLFFIGFFFLNYYLISFLGVLRMIVFDVIYLFVLFEFLVNHFIKIQIEKGEIILNKPLRKWSVYKSNHNDNLIINGGDWDKIIFSNDRSVFHFLFYKNDELVYYFEDIDSHKLVDYLRVNFHGKKVLEERNFNSTEKVSDFVIQNSHKVI